MIFQSRRNAWKGKFLKKIWQEKKLVLLLVSCRESATWDTSFPNFCSCYRSLPRMGENSSHEQNEILKISLQLIRITIKNLTTLVYENELISFF